MPSFGSNSQIQPSSISPPLLSTVSLVVGVPVDKLKQMTSNGQPDEIIKYLVNKVVELKAKLSAYPSEVDPKNIVTPKFSEVSGTTAS